MEHILTTKGTMPRPETISGASIPEYIEVKATDGNTVAFLSPESDGVVAWIDDEQNGSCTIEIELPITGSTEEQASKILTTKGVTSEVTTLATGDKWQYLTDKYRIYADGKEFVILNPDAVDKQRDGKKLTGKIKAHESWTLLGKKFQTISNDPQNPSPPWGAVIIVSGGAAHGGFDPGSAGSALSYLLNGTGWTVDTVDVTGTYDLETEKESVLYNINQVQEKWGGILVWDSVNKTVSLRDEEAYQPYTGYQIRYAKNLKGINRVDDYDIVTRLYPFGENDLNISAVNGGLLYLDNQSYSTEVLEGVWYNQDIADQTQLKAQAEKQLAVMCKPRHNYKTEVLDLRSLPGYGHETFKRSDMVDLYDEEFGANARVRIIRYRYNVFQPWLCDMELGDPIEKIQATVAQTVLMAKFYKNVVAPNTSFQNLLKAIINTEATEINGANGDYTLVDGVSTWKDPDTGDLVRITPKGLIISEDGGQTWKTAISGKGIHADAGWLGKLNAGVITVGADTTFETGYNPVDNHLYFQYSEDGATSWHDTFNSASDKYMRQKVGDNGTWSDPMRVVGEDGYTPVKGTDYFDGVDGQNGTSSYLWVRYSQNANGNPMTTDPANAKYIGVATTNVPSAPTSYASYSWSLIKGTDGVPGEPGADGQTSYLHIKYSDDGTSFTANNGETVGAWIGTYVDFTQADSTVFSKYTWNKVKGEDGQDVRIFTSQPVPPYGVGDLWIKDDNSTFICNTARASGAYNASDWRDVSANKFDNPGYVIATDEGIKVFDAENALRVLVGSWVKDHIRKYGIKIIEGEMYSSLIRSGAEDATTYIQLIPPNLLQVYSGGKKQLEIDTEVGGRIQFFRDGTYTGDVRGTGDGKIYVLGLGGIDLHGTGRIPGVTCGYDLHVSGNFSKTGSYSAIEPTHNYGKRLLYGVESPELLYCDRYVGRLENGEAVIKLDPIFLECIEPDTELTPWSFLTECYGENDVYVVEWGEDWVKVKERNNGNSNYMFVLWIVATRKNYAGIRLMEVVN